MESIDLHLTTAEMRQVLQDTVLRLENVERL